MNNANPRPKSTELSEKHIQQTCTQWLELDGWRALRTDPVSRREWGKGFGEVGMADHLYIRYGLSNPFDPENASQAEVLWIEFKRAYSSLARGPRVTKATEHQKAWHAVERARGALTLIAGVDFPASIKGFQDWYRKSGLMRRNLR